MVVLDHVHLDREAERRGEPDLVLVLVRTVAPAALGGDEVRRAERLLPGDLPDIVEDAVFIEELLRLELALGHLVSEPEGDAGVHNRLAAQGLLIVLQRYVYVREDLQVGPPAYIRTGLLAVGGLALQLADDAALFKVQRVLLPVAADSDVHILARVLGGAAAQAVEAERILVIAAVIVAVFAAGIELAEDELPVPALLHRVPVHRAAAAEVLALDTLVEIARQCYNVAVSGPRLVD